MCKHSGIWMLQGETGQLHGHTEWDCARGHIPSSKRSKASCRDWLCIGQTEGSLRWKKWTSLRPLPRGSLCIKTNNNKTYHDLCNPRIKISNVILIIHLHGGVLYLFLTNSISWTYWVNKIFSTKKVVSSNKNFRNIFHTSKFFSIRIKRNKKARIRFQE